jgi:hypothetical protein
MPSQGLKQWFPHLPSALDRAPMAGLMCAGALLLGVVLAGARSSNSNELGTPSATSVKPGTQDSDSEVRFHEGDELVDQAGRFSPRGDRMLFLTADGKIRLITLENATLDRIAIDLDGNSGPRQWIVSGKVTEYRGSNYLLLTRAQRKSEAATTGSKP